MERFERLEPLARPDEHDRPFERRDDGERGPAPGVPVQLGQDQPVDRHRPAEPLRHPHRVLPGHRVEHQQRGVGGGRLPDPRQFGQQRRVDVQPARRVDDQHVRRSAGVLEGPPSDLHRIPFPARRKHRDSGRLAEDLELGDRRRTVHVGGRQEDAPPLLLEVERELAGGRGLPGPVQAHEEEHRGRVRGEPQGMVDGAQETGELAEHDLDDLLTGREALPHLLADRRLADPVDELPRDLEVDVGFEQGQPDLAERLVHVLGPEPASSSKPS